MQGRSRDELSSTKQLLEFFDKGLNPPKTPTTVFLIQDHVRKNFTKKNRVGFLWGKNRNFSVSSRLDRDEITFKTYTTHHVDQNVCLRQINNKKVGLKMSPPFQLLVYRPT